MCGRHGVIPQGMHMQPAFQVPARAQRRKPGRPQDSDSDSDSSSKSEPRSWPHICIALTASHGQARSRARRPLPGQGLRDSLSPHRDRRRRGRPAGRGDPTARGRARPRRASALAGEGWIWPVGAGLWCCGSAESRGAAAGRVPCPRSVRSAQGVQASSDYYPSHYLSHYIGRYPTRYPGRYPGRYPSRPVADHVVEIRSRSRDYAESIRNVHTLCARRTLSESSESLFESLSVRKVRAFYARRARCARAFVGG